ncbi:hypothetical protein Spock_85 [Bacillus phage Spock]|uniref:Uncharacterized protein n=1 Tax=Bacillus phage Spock TaxID=1406791 RepID=U5PWY1_9CAUD|nr:hypothetical protein Spock_85 [Bacillus phage Spock]AGY48485.1 hypothetical protein Spock_85 [Bacillus phage Spock]
MNDKMRDLMRQASFRQMYYVDGNLPTSEVTMYKNTGIDTTEAKKKLKLSFNTEEKVTNSANRWQDVWSRHMNDISDKIREIQDMKFRKWLYLVVLEDFGYDFIGCKIEPVEQNTVKLTNISTDEFLILYIERTEVDNLTNHWMELKWKLYQHDKKIKEGRDFLNMEIKFKLV